MAWTKIVSILSSWSPLALIKGVFAEAAFDAVVFDVFEEWEVDGAQTSSWTKEGPQV